VSQIDDVFGRLMRDLEDRGLAEDTIVIYSSDHGGYHGVHGLPEKAPGICSESVCRVPMFWRVPGVTPAGGVCGQLVESVDVAPTLAKLCGMDPMETADGEDISALLAGGEEPVRSLAVTENPWSKAVRWDRWRYVHYPEGFFDDGEAAGELYDLHADPLERNNLFDDPAHRAVVQEGRRRLLDWLIQTSRIVTTHPAILYGDNLAGRHDYPICSDGRGPNFIQPRRRDDNDEAYL
jgi:uncharacterized sulfatase